MAPVEERSRPYETRDVNLRAVALAVAGILAVIVAAHLSMYLLFIGAGVALQGAQGKADADGSGGASSEGTVPHLQLSPRAEAEEILRRERHRLETYGWVDRDAGVVRVPIERAMELYVARERERERASEGGDTDGTEKGDENE